MKRIPYILTVFAVSAALAGCGLAPKSESRSGSLVIKYASVLPVYVDGEESGFTNSMLEGLEPGPVTVSIGDPSDPAWSGQVSIESDETVSIDATTEAFDPPAQDDGSEAEIAETEELPKELVEFWETTPVEGTDDTVSKAIAPSGTREYIASLTSDFAKRDKIPQTPVPRSRWYKYGTFGPPATVFSKATVPAGYNATQWKRDRVIEVAKKYLGVKYRHKHIPMLGLDCSNYTSWVYNYGLGIKFTSNVRDQAATVGRRVKSTEALQRGDLVFFKNSSGRIIHAGIYIDAKTMIDESSVNKNGVTIKAFSRSRKSFAFARRVI